MMSRQLKTSQPGNLECRGERLKTRRLRLERVHRYVAGREERGHEKDGAQKTKSMDEYTDTISPGRVMMTMCCSPTRLPSSLLVYAGLRYVQRDRDKRE